MRNKHTGLYCEYYNHPKAAFYPCGKFQTSLFTEHGTIILKHFVTDF